MKRASSQERLSNVTLSPATMELLSMIGGLQDVLASYGEYEEREFSGRRSKLYEDASEAVDKFIGILEKEIHSRLSDCITLNSTESI